MFGLMRSNPVEEMLDLHRNVDRFFNHLWQELPTRTTSDVHNGFHVRSADGAWKVSVPMPGIDPRHVTLDISGSTLSIRAEQPEEMDTPYARFEQTITMPNVVDLDKIKASYRHGVLELTLPWKESVKPRRIQIDTKDSEPTQLHAVAF